MSIEIFQFPEKASESDLVELLIELGYESGENLFWHGPEGTKHFFWADTADFKSTSGVDASVFPLDDKGKKAWKVTSCKWVLRTRSSIWASSFDKDFQNQTVRTVRKKFGGRFYNDHFGHNRYIQFEKEPSTPASRGLFSIREQLKGDLDSLEYSLPEEKVQFLDTPKGIIDENNDPMGLLAFSKQLDPSRVVYNALVPFLIAGIEYFFRESFEILLKYDENAKLKLNQSSRKVPFADASALARGEFHLESIVSSWYSFQNLDSINKAYSENLQIDIWKTLRRRKKIRKKLPLLTDALNNLIGARHGVVHHFSLDRNLSREDFLNLIHLVKTIINVMSKEFEQKLGIKFGPG